MSRRSVITRLDHELKPIGFVRQNTTWNRKFDHIIEVVNIQANAITGTVTMNFGVLEPNIYKECWENEPQPFIDEASCIVRARIGELQKSNDIWWNLKDDSSTEEIVSCLKLHGLPFLTQMHSFEEMCNWLNTIGVPSKRIPLPSIYFALLQRKMGNMNQACAVLNDLNHNALGAWKVRAGEIFDQTGCKPIP